MTAPLAVTHAVLSLDCGGLERIVVDLVREGQRRGQRVSVICVERPGTLACQIRALEACVVCLNKPPGRDAETVRRAVAALRELRPAVLHTHQIGALLHVGKAAKEAGVPVVVHTEHGNHIKSKTWLRRIRHRALWGWAGRRAARFFCVSEEIAREVTRFRAVPRGKVLVLPNGIDAEKFAACADAAAVRAEFGVPLGALVVGTIGRLHEVKRQDLLIRAFGRVRTRFPKAHLILVGDGPARANLVALVNSLALGPAVHFVGYQARPERALSAMDVFTLTSRSEGMPLSLLEAWATGLPVIASAVGGIPAMIEHGRSGLLFQNGDEDGLVAALSEVLTDPGRARGLSRAGQAHVRKHYSLERMATQYESHYSALLSLTRGRRLERTQSVSEVQIS